MKDILHAAALALILIGVIIITFSVTLMILRYVPEPLDYVIIGFILLVVLTLYIYHQIKEK